MGFMSTGHLGVCLGELHLKATHLKPAVTAVGQRRRFNECLLHVVAQVAQITAILKRKGQKCLDEWVGSIFIYGTINVQK